MTGDLVFGDLLILSKPPSHIIIITFNDIFVLALIAGIAVLSILSCLYFLPPKWSVGDAWPLAVSMKQGAACSLLH